MKRLSIPFVLVLLALALAGPATAKTIPVLSGAFGLPGSEGFGHAKPPKIYLGGDPTGLVCHIHWTRWGGQLAVGIGTGWYVSRTEDVAGGHAAPVVVVLYHLGTWHGKPAYTEYRWYFPQGGSTFGGRVPRCTA